jgi:hypothetical protein
MASHPPDLMHNAVGVSGELSRRNVHFALLLALLMLVLFAASFGVGFLYLWLS